MDIISGNDFLKRIKESPSGAYLFYGEEDYLKGHALTSLAGAMNIDEGMEFFNFLRLDVPEYTADKLIDALSLPPMMAERKLVAVRGLDIGKMYRPGADGNGVGEFRELIDALAHLDEFDYNTFVLVVPSGGIAEEQGKRGMSGALKELSERLVPVKFEAPTEQKLIPWAMRHLEHYGIGASEADCAYIVKYCGRDMLTLTSEIKKLALYTRAKGESRISREDIDAVCCEQMEYGAFEFSNAILEGRRSDALTVLSIMKFRQIKPPVILGELAGIFSDLLRIKIMLESGKNAYQIAQITGLNQYKVGIYATVAQKMELARVRRIVEMTSQADIAMKTQFDGGYLQLEKLICSL